jgi:addiction module HigA family antidote
MTNPPHPGDLIRSEILEPLGLSVFAAAEALGIRRATLSDLINEKSSLTPEMALRIEKAFGPTMDHLLRMQLAYDVAKMRNRADEIKVSRYMPDLATGLDSLIDA